MMQRPLVVDLFCGLGGWAEGFLSEGYECRGFDIEAHDYGSGGYPGELILRDVRSIHGSELKDATCIVGSSPCQEFSYRAMPWKRAKALPPPYLGMELFNAQFRIQREASEAAGHHIPMVVENVRGAQKWVGRAQWHYGSFYLWGDVPALMPMTLALKEPGQNWNEWKDWDGTDENKPASVRPWGDAPKDGFKTAGMNWSNRDIHGQDFTRVAAAQRYRGGVKQLAEGVKVGGSGAAWFREPLQAKRREATAIKNGGDWFGSGENCSEQRKHSSRSNSRKAASAMIAKIPYSLASHIARSFKPHGLQLVEVS